MCTSRKQRGQSLVEFAISLTFIIILLAGVVDFGIAFFTFIQLRDAAQEGALYGSMNPGDDAGIETRVRSASTTPVDLSDTDTVDVDIQYDGDQCEGNGVTVDVTTDHQLVMPLIGSFIGSQEIPIHASVTDTILTPICGDD